jgi:hypothetical protein
MPALLTAFETGKKVIGKVDRDSSRNASLNKSSTLKAVS